MPLDHVLIVDDEPLIRKFLLEFFNRKGIKAECAESGKKALTLLKEHVFDLVLTDMKLGDMTGIEVLTRVKELSDSTLVIVMTAFGSIENAIEAMKKGAYHYILKPFTLEVLEITLQKAEEHLALFHENRFLRGSQTEAKIVAVSRPMQTLLTEVEKIAKSSASVLVHGESGTGKELIAGAIHKLSLRAQNPYIKVNCAAIPETLLESEFFGHEKGSFTGALIKRIGRFELADKGTLFLDEVTEIPLALQPKLLRAIQEQEFERVGGTKTVSVNVRFISSSNRDLKKAIAEKIFREDLFYRLNVIPIYLPPLRERSDDIIPLSNYFLSRFSEAYHKKKKTLSESAIKKLHAYSWPGNIRELGNMIERVVVLQESPIIEASHLHMD